MPSHRFRDHDEWNHIPRRQFEGQSWKKKKKKVRHLKNHDNLLPFNKFVYKIHVHIQRWGTNYLGSTQVAFPHPLSNFFVPVQYLQLCLSLLIGAFHRHFSMTTHMSSNCSWDVPSSAYQFGADASGDHVGSMHECSMTDGLVQQQEQYLRFFLSSPFRVLTSAYAHARHSFV